MNTDQIALMDAWMLEQSTESLLAAEAKPDTRTPTQWLRVVRARPAFEGVSRLVIVDVLRLPGAQDILRHASELLPFEYLQQVTGPVKGPTLRGRFSGVGVGERQA